MIAGHFGLAAAVKSRATQIPLWALMLAAVWLDLVFVPLFLSGIETIVPAPGVPVGYGGAIIHADYTHSLVGAVLLSALLGWLAGFHWGARNGMIIALMSFSHWVLDLVVHRPDMPILPGNALGLPELGCGLWRIPADAAIVEFAILIAGAYLYRRAALAAFGEDWRVRRTASLCATLILVFGLLVLILDVTGITG